MQTAIGGACRSQMAGGHRAAQHAQPSGVCRVLGRPCKAASAAVAAHTAPEDKWIARTTKEVPAPAPGLASLREQSAAALTTLRMPSTRNEDYRFTDIAPLLRASVQPAPAGAPVPKDLLDAHALPGAAAVAVIVDGVIRQDLSRGLGHHTNGAYVGPVGGAPAHVAAKLGSLSSSRGGPFAALNGALATDALAVAVPEGAALPGPLHVLYLSSSAAAGPDVLASAPRLLVHVGARGAAEVVEEYAALPGAGGGGGGAEGGRYATLGVAEVVLEADASVKHSYAQREAAGAFHLKATLVSQAERSSYSVVEGSVGGALGRHDLIILQAGPETHTEMRHFLLCGPSQLHDLHSRLQLDHPHGVAKQLHKCIVSHASGRGVFDGNVKVNRGAQKTDAGQLSRNLLLVPLATVNVKPNLQIIADDVKCTHGCAVSDLRDEELFYFRARGISAEAARQALVLSFGAEVVQRMGHPELEKRLQDDVGRTLRSSELFANSAAAQQ